MSIWDILPDGTTYRSFHTPDLSPREYLVATDVFRRGWPLDRVWTPMRVEFFEGEGEDEKPVGDFPSMGGLIPLAISARALDILHPLIKDDVEVLRLITDVGEFKALNVFTCDCLDHSRSAFVRHTHGGIMRVEKYAFRPGCLDGKYIFRIPEEWTHVLVDDKFKQTVEENGLEGLLFYKVQEADNPA